MSCQRPEAGRQAGKCRGRRASVEAASGQERLAWWVAASLFRWATRAGVVTAADASALRTPACWSLDAFRAVLPE